MKPWLIVELLGAAAVVTAVVLMAQEPGPAAAPAPRWHVVDLGVLPGAGVAFPGSSPTGIDERGDVIGRSSMTGGMHAFLWRRGRMHDLGTLGGANSEPAAIAGRRIVGWADTPSGRRHAVVWIDGRIHDLGTVGRLEQSEATSFDGYGDVVGFAFDAADDFANWVPVAWSADGADPLLSGSLPLPGVPDHEHGCLMHAWDSLGSWSVGACHGRAAVWEDGYLKTITRGAGEAWDVSDVGAVVGDIAGPPTRAFVWRLGRLTLLPMLPGGGGAHAFSQALFVNEDGEIAGVGTTRSGERHAVLWRYGR